MPYTCPYTPIELHQLNPHGFDYNHRVTLPDGRTGTISKMGRRSVYVDVDTGADWSGPARELRPAIPSEFGQPRVQKLRLF